MPAAFWDTDDIEARILQRADMVNSLFVTQAELTSVAAVAFQEFYMQLVSQFEELCVQMTPVTIALTSSTTLANLPTNLLKLKGLRIQNEDFLTPLSSVMEIEGYTRDGHRGKPTRYWMAGVYDGASGTPAKVMPLVLPDGAYTLECFFVPNITLADVDSDTAGAAKLHALAYADEYVVLKGAMKLKDKEESDCSVIMAELKQIWAIIEKFLTPMDESMPRRVVQHAYRYPGLIDPFGAEDDFG